MLSQQEFPGWDDPVALVAGLVLGILNIWVYAGTFRNLKARIERLVPAGAQHFAKWMALLFQSIHAKQRRILISVVPRCNSKYKVGSFFDRHAQELQR